LDVNERNEAGATLLMLMAGLGQTELVQRLINAGADVNLKCQAGWTALKYAIANDHLGVILLLVNHNTQILHVVDTFGETALMLTAVKNNSAAAKALINAGADVDAVTSEGHTAPSYYDHISLVRILLEAGADVNRAQNNGMTALMWAACEGYTNIATALINAEADINKVNLAGKSAMVLANEEEHYPIVRLLEAKQIVNSQKDKLVSFHARVIQVESDLVSSDRISWPQYQGLWQFALQIKQELQNILASNAFIVSPMSVMFGMENEGIDKYSYFEERVTALETHKKGCDITLSQENSSLLETASWWKSSILPIDKKRKGKEEVTEPLKRPRIEEKTENGINISHSMRQMLWSRRPEMTEQFPEESLAQSNSISIDLSS
jgi:ankyrin repeat protein